MKIEQVQMICFSGTGTTRAVAQAVAQGTGLPVKEWDCLPQRANAPFQPDEHTLTILAVPSFGGRAPAPMAQRLEQMKGCGPVVLLSVYGARASEDTLVELYDLAEKTGYQPIAAGEFVARHSIATRIAAHRPSEDDLAQARELGKQALELAESLAPGARPVLEIPGNRPYKKFGGSAAHPLASDACVECGRCADQCAAGAIPAENPRETDHTVCITCMRCVAVCPMQARSLPAAAQAATLEKLSKICDENRANQTWLAR